jgi:hypothetical protein
MKRSRIIFFVFCLFFILLSGRSFAVNVTATPASTAVGQPVTVTAAATFAVGGPAPNCDMRVNYGDGTGVVTIGTCVTALCSITANHVYASPGTFTITLSTQSPLGGACASLIPPTTATAAVSVGGGALTVSAFPPQASIPRGQSSSTGIQYQFRSSSPVNARASSSSGSFVAQGSVISTVNAPVSGTIRNGIGSAVETVALPVGLVERVLRMGLTRFSYQRSFNVSGTTIGNTNVEFIITTEAASSLGIKKIDLYFEDKRPEITIEKGRKNLKAFADISYTGSGLFEGYWEVDGRVLSRVYQQLSFGGLLKLQTPDIPELPTFDPGTHRVRFVITRPTQPVPLPVIIYFVALDVFKPAFARIGLTAPQNGESVTFPPGKFEWERPANVSVFLVQYGDKLESKAIFSAYTRDTSYTMPDAVLRTNFKGGERYYWKVIGFDDENIIIGESAVQSFIFRME